MENGYRAALAQASTSCKTAADCVAVEAACTHSSCVPVYVNASAKDAYVSTTTPLRDECSTFHGMGCDIILAIPTATCAAYWPVCGQDGQCRATDVKP
jgi:hypothetical protein